MTENVLEVAVLPVVMEDHLGLFDVLSHGEVVYW